LTVLPRTSPCRDTIEFLAAQTERGLSGYERYDEIMERVRNLPMLGTAWSRELDERFPGRGKQ
jgi:hypothetical protein